MHVYEFEKPRPEVSPKELNIILSIFMFINQRRIEKLCDNVDGSVRYVGFIIVITIVHIKFPELFENGNENLYLVLSVFEGVAICYRAYFSLFHVMLSVNLNASEQTRPYLCKKIKNKT